MWHSFTTTVTVETNVRCVMIYVFARDFKVSTATNELTEQGGWETGRQADRRAAGMRYLVLVFSVSWTF